MPDKLRLLGCVVFLALLSAVSPALAFEANVGDRAIDLKGWDIVDQRTVSLDDYFGRWVLVDFWATWCGPCMAELPNMLQVTRPYVERGELAVITVSLDEPDSLDKLRQTIRRTGLCYPVLYDGGGFQSVAAQEWSVSGIPSSFLINPQGVIVMNELRGGNLERMLDFYLHQDAPLVGLSVSRVYNDDNTLSLLAQVRNTSHQPMDLELFQYSMNYVYDPADPTCRIIDYPEIYPDLIYGRVEFGEFCETTYEFHLKPMPERHSLIYHVSAKVPGTGTAAQNFEDAFELDCGSRQIIFIPLKFEDGDYFYMAPPDDKLREYEVVEEE